MDVRSAKSSVVWSKASFPFFFSLIPLVFAEQGVKGDYEPKRPVAKHCAVTVDKITKDNYVLDIGYVQHQKLLIVQYL